MADTVASGGWPDGRLGVSEGGIQGVRVHRQDAHDGRRVGVILDYVVSVCTSWEA